MILMTATVNTEITGTTVSILANAMLYDTDRQPTVLPGSESVTRTTILPSLSSVTARPTERSDVRSARSMLARSGPMSWAGTRARSPSRRVRPLNPTPGPRADIADGWANFSCSAESVSVWTKTDARGRDEFKKD